MRSINLFFVSIFFTLVNINLCSAQEESKLEFSASFGIGYFEFLSSGGIYGDYNSVEFVNEPQKQTQLNINGDIGIRLDSYIFSFFFAKGLVDPIPYKQANYSEYNITVGKEVLNFKWFTLEGHVGAGYFTIEEQYSDYDPITSYGAIGFPIRLKANFHIGKHFSVGINPNANFNFAGNSSIVSVNLIGQIRI